MASFTDNSQALSHFNPYISQIPVDAYLNVGLQKQQQYDQGVQRVQGDIDSIANLPVIKPEQKDYVSERMNQLQGSISKVVGQDFSNSQLVNQIGGLTSQIASDPIIQSAVTSTAKYQAESASMEKAKSEGKSDIANEYDFNNSFSKWMNDKDVRSSFTGSYTPYTDVKKKLVDAINQLHPDETVQDIPFKMQDGQIVKDAAGAPVIDDVMMQKLSKTLSPAKIQAAIDSSLSEGDLNQLAINGRYEYRGLDKQGLKNVADASYQNRLSQINETLKGYAVQKLSNTTDQVYQQDLDKKINDLTLHRDSLIQQYPQDIKFLDQNPDAYKGELYKQSYLSNLTNGYAYATNSLTYKDNPYFKAYMEKEKNAREASQFMMEYGPGGYKDKELQFKEKEMEIKAWEFSQRKAGKINADGTLAEPALGLPIEGGQTSAQIGPTPTVDTFNRTTADMEFTLRGAQLKTAAGLFNKPGDPNNPVTVGTDGSISYKDKASQDYVETAMAKLRDQWIADPSSVSTDAANFFKQYDDIENRVNNRNFSIAQAGNKANLAPGSVNPDDVYKSVPSLTINSKAYGISNETLSGRQLADFSRKLNSVYTYAGGGGGAAAPVLDDGRANAIFSTNAEKAMYHTVKKAEQEGYGSLTPAQQTIMDRLHQVSVLSSRSAPALAVRAQEIDKQVPGLMQAEIPASFPINTSKKERENQIQALANNLVDNFKKQGADELPGGATMSNIAKIFKTEKGTTYSLEAQGNNQYALKLSNAGSGVPSQSIPLTADQVNTYFPEANIKQFSAVNEALALTRNGDKSTTDVQNRGAASAFVMQNPNLNQYSVKYHVEDPSRTGSNYQIKAYVLDRGVPAQPGQQPVYREIDVPLPSFLGQTGLANFIANFGDNEVRALLAKQTKK